MLVRRFFRFAPVLLAVAAGAVLLGGCRGRFCRWHSRSPEEKADRIAKRIASELNLSADQKAGLDKIKSDILARKQDFQALHGGFREEVLAQIRAGKVDKDKLNQSLEAREAKEKDLRAFMVGEFAAFHDLLDSAQREKLAAKIESHCGGGCCR